MDALFQKQKVLTEIDLSQFWLPFTANQRFKSDPILLESASGMYYTTSSGQQLLDATAGLWCCNAGHGRQSIAQAVNQQMLTLDYAPSFNVSHPLAFKLAQRLTSYAPKGLNRVFFTNSGSESVDTALKIALAYHRKNGDSQRTLLIGRERAYHGVNFGGMSVGGIANNRKQVANLLPNIAHLSHTYDRQRNAFSPGMPLYGKEYADSLLDLIKLHDASTIAAVIVEPVAGAGGVHPPPQGYLALLRHYCDQYGILLIFDEVITACGRLGSAFAANRFEVKPDIITMAKGLTSGTLPMGAVLVDESIYDVFMHGDDNEIELFHGYTYSGHPACCAAALATFDIYDQEQLFAQALDKEVSWQEALHSLVNAQHVVDIRTIGLLGAIDLQENEHGPGLRGYAVFRACLEQGLFIRVSGDSILLSPPLIINKKQIELIASILAHVLTTID